MHVTSPSSVLRGSFLSNASNGKQISWIFESLLKVSESMQHYNLNIKVL